VLSRTEILTKMVRRLEHMVSSGVVGAGGDQSAIVHRASEDLMSPIRSRREATKKICLLENKGWQEGFGILKEDCVTNNQLRLIFMAYASSAVVRGGAHYICFPQMLNFMRDFCLIPELTTSR